MSDLIPIERIENRIYLIRGQKVMLDFDLAELYDVLTRRLNEQVKRNIERFPADFMFPLTREEILRMSQFATSSLSKRYENIKFYKNVNAFTEQGVAMLSSVLRSKRAVQVNIIIMRVFIRIRKILSNHRELVERLNQLEKKFEKHDEEIRGIFAAIRQLMTDEQKPARRIGFKVD